MKIEIKLFPMLIGGFIIGPILVVLGCFAVAQVKSYFTPQKVVEIAAAESKARVQEIMEDRKAEVIELSNEYIELQILKFKTFNKEKRHELEHKMEKILARRGQAEESARSAFHVFHSLGSE